MRFTASATCVPALALALALALGAPASSPIASADAAPSEAHSGGIAYRTFFQDPGSEPTPDFSLEDHAIGLINTTPTGARITFAFRDFNRDPVTDALIAAHKRGVIIDGVIDGQERTQAAVVRLQGVLGADHFVFCGSPTFEFLSCIANSPAYKPSLQHNKFMTFSRLADGRENVVLQTSENFLWPSQYHYYNDMVEIAGDRALHDAYAQYVADMKAQLRSDDRYVITPGDDGRNTMFPSPRRQASIETDDTIVDRLSEIDCSEGGSPTGHGLIRVANMAFRTERAVIATKLVELHRAGCDIDVIASNLDGDIVAGLVSAGVPLHPFFRRGAGARRQVMVHDKFWLVDAKRTLTGRRTKITYAGSSNWRGDQQYSDDMLLRIIDDDVYAAYVGYWNLMRSRVVSDLSRRTTEAVPPASALTATPTANAAGWRRSDVTVRIAASDGHNVQESGLKRLHVEMSGAENGAWDFADERSGFTVHELPITAEGETTVTYFAEDNAGNREPISSEVIRIDKTVPTIAGFPADCRLWPPNNKLVHVADVSASDTLSGLDGTGLSLSASSGEAGDVDDVVIGGGSVDLRAAKAARGGTRVYELRAAAADIAGNSATAAGTCVVPHSNGRSAEAP